MEKGKLFSPEDFDKPIEKKWWQKRLVKILGIAGALIVVVVILLSVFFKYVDKKEMHAPLDSIENTQNESMLEDNTISKTEGVEIQKVDKAEFELENPSIDGAEETPTPEDTQKEEETQKAVADEKVSNNVETEALNVIHGAYGNGEVRKSKLGDRYQSIQNRVNELKRQGAF